MTARRTAAAGAALMLTLAACTTGTEHESTVGVKERPLSTVVSPAAPAAAEAGRTSTAADSLRAAAAGAPAQAP
ncbi:MAG: thiol:disulfide interchange protein DsbA/DsbL, partial [Acidimicrobiales bacterium]